MVQMLCRNRVTDFEHWKGVFNSHSDFTWAAGLLLVNMWQDLDDPCNIFFLFDVADLPAAKVFINSFNNVEVGELAGVIESEYHFITTSTSEQA